MAELNRIPGVESRIARTKRRLRNLALWEAYWPLVAVLAVFLTAAMLGLFGRVSDQVAAFGALLFFAGVGVTLVRGLRRYRGPSEDDAIQALDAQSDLRPLVSLQDRPARPDKDGVALWRAHETRLTDEARRLSVPGFWKNWRESDPVFLRFVLPLALLGAVLVGGTQSGSRIMSALSPDYGSLMGAEHVRIEAWITPPDYTGRAPVLFKPDQQDARVPAGSVMTLRVEAPSRPKLRSETETRRTTTRFEATPDGAYEISTEILGDTELSVRWWGERRAFTLYASPDDPPAVQYVELPKLGENDQTEFEWEASDDYGISQLEFAIRPERSDRDYDRVNVDIGALAAREASDESALDMTRHRYAGLRVEARLIVTDGAGQEGLSEPHVFILPEKLLLQPLAKAIQDVRVTILREDDPYQEADVAEDALVPGELFLSSTQRLQQAPAGLVRAALMVDALTYEAPRYFDDILIYSGLRSTQRTLEVASSLEEAQATETLLWGLVLRAEYGTAADALAALQAARNALEEALRDGASEEEIARLMEAFKQAAQNYLAARMAEAFAQGLDAPPPSADSGQQGGSSLGGQDFADMLEALQDLTETGAADQARQLLADITNMLENLEFQQGSGSGDGSPGMPGQQGENEEDDTPQEERELSETMRELSELLRQQRELNDETLAQQRGEGSEGQGEDFEGMDPRFGPDHPENIRRRQQQQGNQQPGNGAEDGVQQDGENAPGQAGGALGRSLVERQLRLGQLVEELGRRRGTGEGSGLLDQDTLDAIERAQRRAGRALEDGNEPRALNNQEQATRQLRELAEGLADDLDERRAERLGEPQDGQRGSADPFGRNTMGGVDDSDSVDIPDIIDRQRARDILEELRRRYGETPDEDERDYLERLLDRF